MIQKITIGIDIRDLKVAKTGTQTYLSELCREFKLINNSQYQFFFFDTIIPVYIGENKLLKLVEHARYQFWKQIILPIKAWSKGCDILFCTDNYVPYVKFNFQTVPVFHDAFFFETPEHFNKYWLWIFKKLALPAAKNSPIVVTPTQYAKEQIHFHTKIDLNKLIVVYEGPKSLALPEKKNQAPNTESNSSLSTLFKNEDYILHVGVMNKRKNIPTLIHAFKKIKETGFPSLKLVLAGRFEVKQHSSDFENIQRAIRDSGYENDIVLPGYLSNVELSQLYAHAQLYVFPSLNEGFGIPILEAWSYHIPVLVADNTCLPEVGGNAVITFNPLDIDDLAQKISEVLKNDEQRKLLIERGTKRLSQFSWRNTAEHLLKEFTLLVERKRNL